MYEFINLFLNDAEYFKNTVLGTIFVGTIFLIFGSLAYAMWRDQ